MRNRRGILAAACVAALIASPLAAAPRLASANRLQTIGSTVGDAWRCSETSHPLVLTPEIRWTLAAWATQEPLTIEKGEDDLGAFRLLGRLVEDQKEGVWVELRGPADRIAATYDFHTGSQHGIVVLWDAVKTSTPSSSPAAHGPTASLRPRAVQEYERGKLHGIAWRLPQAESRGVVLRYVKGRLAPDVGNISEAPQRPDEQTVKRLRRAAQRHREAAKRILERASQQGLLKQPS